MQERQTDIFDFEKYELKHSSFKNSLLELNKIIDWSSFLPILNEAFSKEKKSTGGRKPFDRILMLKIIDLLGNKSKAQKSFYSFYLLLNTI